MKEKKPVFFILLFAGFILFIFLIMQPIEIKLGGDIAMLYPKGQIALKERNLLLTIQAIMLLVVIPVYILTFVFSWKYRADNPKGKYEPHLQDHRIAETIWWGIPLVIVAIISVLTWIRTHELDPFKPLVSDKKPLKIQVVALQWKWLFLYPEEKIASINFVQFPENTPVHFEITADAPMNSFWIPQLGSQIYAMPKMKTELNLIADKVGDYRGASANISGVGFSGMHFIARASTEKEFQEWVDSAKASKRSLTFNEYRALAKPSQDHPVALYELKDEDLFDEILMKFMHPQKNNGE
jgi:cytochrome o ubiquinol oxidase subunit 2